MKHIVDIIIEVDLFLTSEKLPDGLSEEQKQIYVVALRAWKDFLLAGHLLSKSQKENYKSLLRESIILETSERILKTYRA